MEYLVVKYDKEKPRVLVSLRQADILDALANDASLAAKCGYTSAHADGTCDPKPRQVLSPALSSSLFVITGPKQRYPARFPPGIWTVHAGINAGKALGDRIERAPRRGAEYEVKVRGHALHFDFLSPGYVKQASLLRSRRVIAKDHMNPDEYPITLTTFPRLGSPGVFSDPYYPVSGSKLRSQFVPDEIANPHIRFPTLAANIRSRRGRKVQVNVPVFRDTNTPWPWKDPTVNFDLHQWPEDDDERNGAAPDNFIHMDAMAFGMGSCCLQITFQAKNITEGRRLYDQLSPLGPILLALTAATPVYKGFLADTDVRWNQISSAVDDRTLEELGEEVSPPRKDGVGGMGCIC